MITEKRSREHAPMDVRMVERADDFGTVRIPQPALDSTWSQVDRLRWKAGCVRAETGVTVTIHEFEGIPGFALSWGNSGISSMGWVDAHHWLTAFAQGYAEAVRVAGGGGTVGGVERMIAADEATARAAADESAPEWEHVYYLGSGQIQTANKVGQPGYEYVEAYAGQSIFGAVRAAYRAKRGGAGCVKVEWR